MQTIAIYVLGFFIVVALTMVTPGLKTIISPVWSALGHGIVIFMQWIFSWVIYLYKRVWSSHVEIFRHLVLKDKDLDVRRRMK